MSARAGAAQHPWRARRSSGTCARTPLFSFVPMRPPGGRILAWLAGGSYDGHHVRYRACWVLVRVLFFKARARRSLGVRLRKPTQCWVRVRHYVSVRPDNIALYSARGGLP